MPKLQNRVGDMLAGADGAGTKGLSEEEKWCIFMRYRHEERAAGLVEKLYREEKGIMRAEKAISKIDRDYWKYAWQMAAEKNRLDRGQRIYDLKQEARAEGLAEGRAEGRTEGRTEGLQEGEQKKSIEVAAKMKAMGDSVEKIQTVTGLSIEKIGKL